MKTAFESKPGTVLKLEWSLFLVVKYEYHRWGRGSTNIKMRLKNLYEGNSIDRVFDGEDKMEDVVLDRSKFEFLYESNWSYAFMSQTTYEQIELSQDDIWDARYYLIEWNLVDVQQFEWRFIWIALPTNVRLTIVECEPGVKWNTADWKIIKEAKTNTWLVVKVPWFVESGEDIIVNTETWEYLERAK